MEKNNDLELLKDYVFNEYLFSNPEKLNELIAYIKKDIENTAKIEESGVFVNELKKVLASAQNLPTIDSYKVKALPKK